MVSLLAVVVLAAAPTPDELVAKVQATYQSAGNLQASFTQTYMDKVRGKKRLESGTLWAAKDGRVRWSYKKPVKKDFVFTGGTAYFYEPESAQVTVFERFQDTPVANALRFLWGQGKLSETFRVEACDEKCKVTVAGDVALRLWPKEPLAAVDHLQLIVDPATGRVRGSIVVDPLGNRSEYAFSEVQFGIPLDDKRFAFEIPKDVSVLRATAEAPKK